MGGEGGRWSAAQKQQQAQAAARTQTTRKGSNKQQNQEQNSKNNNPETVRAVRRLVSRRLVSPKGGAPKCGPKPRKSGAPNGGVPEWWGPRRVEAWGPTYRVFFPSPAPIFVLFFFLSGGLLVELWWCLQRRYSLICTFGVLGLSCETPAAHAWQKEELKKNSIILTLQEQFYTSELSKDIQEAMSLILQYMTMLLFRATSSSTFTMSDVLSISILSSTLDYYREVKCRATDGQYSFCLWIPETRVTRILIRST